MNESSKIKARKAVYHALESGEIKRRSCAKCGAGRAVAHHRDYYKPLNVTWLCAKHHREADMARRARRRTNRKLSGGAWRLTPRRRPAKRRNPVTRSNPSGISGMLMGGAWVYAGMWLGGIIGGFIPRFGSGVIGDVLHGAITAYGVAWVGGRFTRNAGLMAAGAFAPVVGSLLGGVLGGVSGGISSLTSGLTSGVKKPAIAAPAHSSNVVIMPANRAA